MAPEHVKLSDRHDFREVFDYIDGVFLWTSDGEGNLTYLSAGFEEFWGIPSDEIRDDPSRLLDSVHPEDRDRVRSHMEQPGEETTPHSIEHRVVQPDDTVRWVEVRVFPIHDADGTFSELVGITIDITERKRRGLELEAPNRVLRHDVRNEMAVVTGWLDLIDDVPDDDREKLDRVRKASEHVVELTEIARDYTDAVAGEEEPDLESVDVARVLGSELESSRMRYPDATFEVDGALPPVSVGANELLTSVFRNLLNNAVQHTDGEEPNVTVRVEVDPETVCISIADDGPGVPDERKEAVFGKGDAGPDSPGTGIGLYLCREIVAAYDGRIRVEDNDPSGAVFRVELPRLEDGTRPDHAG